MAVNCLSLHVADSSAAGTFKAHTNMRQDAVPTCFDLLDTRDTTNRKNKDINANKPCKIKKIL